METNLNPLKKKFFRIRPIGNLNTGQKVLTYGRYLLGRIEACDLLVKDKFVSNIHAVLEITPSKITIYDINSRHGVFVNQQKSIVAELPLNSMFTIGKSSFQIEEYKKEANLPPVLDSLDPVAGAASPQRQLDKKRTTTPPKSIPESKLPLQETDELEIIYPLSSDPKASYSEYIFEDADTIYPIFKYDVDQYNVEVIILHQEEVFSIDYIPFKNGVYKLKGHLGKQSNDSEIEYPYLAKNEIIDFVSIENGFVKVYHIPTFKVVHLTDTEILSSNKAEYVLNNKDILKFYNGDKEVFLRLTPKAPKVAAPPFFRRDKDLKKYLLLVLFLLLIPITFFNLIYEVDEELEKEKEPERLATILYKQKLYKNVNKTIENTLSKEKKKQTTKNKVVVKKEVEVKDKKIKSVDTKKPKTVVSEVTKEPTKAKVKKGSPDKNPIVKNQTKTGATSKSSNVKKANTTANNKPNIGIVDTYKSADFKSSMNNLLSKGGTIKGVNSVKSSSNVGSSNSANIGTGTNSNLKSASINTDAGSIVGTSSNTIGTVKSAEGLSNKKGVMTAGIPSETVVLGSMDPDIIRRILREHIPQFRYCYQKELDKTNKTFSGVIRLNFTIGASGHVTQAGVDSSSKLPSPVKNCVVSVLRGIQFPQPAGGGTVGVKQPMNFYPTRI